jgi:hypothetical protein
MRRRLQFAGTALAATGLLLLAACAGGGSDASSPASNAVVAEEGDGAASVFIFARPDGNVAMVNLAAGATPLELLPAPFPDSQSTVQRELAYDSDAGLLWYSDNHTRIESIDVATREPGPTLNSFRDVAIIGCTVSGTGRPLAVDVARGAY